MFCYDVTVRRLVACMLSSSTEASLFQGFLPLLHYCCASVLMCRPICLRSGTDEMFCVFGVSTRVESLLIYVVLLGNRCVLRMIRLNQMKFMQYNQLACLVCVLRYLVRIAIPDRMQNTEVPRKHNISDKHVKEEEVKYESHALWLCRCVCSVEPRSHCIY